LQLVNLEGTPKVNLHSDGIEETIVAVCAPDHPVSLGSQEEMRQVLQLLWAQLPFGIHVVLYDGHNLPPM
jgi:hypothetical protein